MYLNAKALYAGDLIIIFRIIRPNIQPFWINRFI